MSKAQVLRSFPAPVFASQVSLSVCDANYACHVQVFDHFCPWVGNAVGKGNRHLFIMFILNMLAALLLAYIVTFGRLSQVGFFDWGPRHRAPMTDEGATIMTWCLAWLVGNIPLIFPVMGLAGAQVMQVCSPPSSPSS